MTLMVEPESKLMSVEEFLALPESGDFELIDGVLTKRKPMGALSDYVAMQLVILLGTFCRQTGAGHVFGSETTYRCFGNPRTGRRGDVSFVRKGRLPGEQIPEGTIDIPADLIVEVVSPNDKAYSVEAKSQLYLNNEFGELWVVFPNTRTVHVRRPGEAKILSVGETLKGQGPLAGFESAVRDVFPA